MACGQWFSAFPLLCGTSCESNKKDTLTPFIECSMAFTLETMKNGTVVELREVNTKGHYTFGRSDTNDYKLEHPSVSRLHAVLQFSATGESFLYDAGSAHGSFLNKQRLKPQVHVPVR